MANRSQTGTKAGSGSVPFLATAERGVLVPVPALVPSTARVARPSTASRSVQQPPQLPVRCTAGAFARGAAAAGAPRATHTASPVLLLQLLLPVPLKHVLRHATREELHLACEAARYQAQSNRFKVRTALALQPTTVQGPICQRYGVTVQ